MGEHREKQYEVKDKDFMSEIMKFAFTFYKLPLLIKITHPQEFFTHYFQ